VQEALLDDGAPEGDDDLQPLTLQQTAPHIERMSEERGGNGGDAPNSILSDSPYAYASASASAPPPPRQIIAKAEAPPPDSAADGAAPPPKQKLEAAPALQDRTARDANTTDAQWAELQASKLVKQREEERMAKKIKECRDQKERERLLEEQQRKLAEAKAVQAKLARMGRCPAGFEWFPVGDGWRCGGGSHFVGADQLARA
jgi:hypothetical protein